MGGGEGGRGGRGLSKSQQKPLLINTSLLKFFFEIN